ncbi:autophagy- protein 2 [Agyrium rufum]|nr:autophagy- protein 2 [Agyrium rufum]
MAYFIPSYVQKRLLRYALSRLDFLDQEKLDFDKLDLSWGKRTTLVLRDVGLELQKLSTLMKLPTQYLLTRGNIHLLRLTIPADLYASGISIEIEGVDVGVSVESTQPAGTEKASEKDRKETLGKGVRANRSRSTGPQVHDPGGNRGKEEDHTLDREDKSLAEDPSSTENLARSFLDREGARTRVKLQAALEKSQSLNPSQVSESYDDDDDGDEDPASDTGYGAAMNLPVFLSNFLQGIIGRLSVKVSSIHIDIDMKLDVDGSSSPSTTQSGPLSIITLQLMVGEVAVDSARLLNKDDIVPRRKISIDGIEGHIVSGMELFNNLSDLSGPPSPLATHSGAFPRSNTDLGSLESPSKIASDKQEVHMQPPRTIQEFGPKSSVLMQGHEPDTLLEDSVVFKARPTLRDLLEGGLEDDPTLSQSIMSSDDPENAQSISSLLQIDYTDDISHQAGPSTGFIEVKGPEVHSSEPQDENPTHSYEERLHAGGKKEDPHADSSDLTSGLIAEDIRRYAMAGSWDPPSEEPNILPSSFEIADEGAIMRNDSRSQTPSPPDSSESDDLSQSRYFSHEEAESMYMSAFSKASMSRVSDQSSPPQDIKARQLETQIRGSAGSASSLSPGDNSDKRSEMVSDSHHLLDSEVQDLLQEQPSLLSSNSNPRKSSYKSAFANIEDGQSSPPGDADSASPPSLARASPQLSSPDQSQATSRITKRILMVQSLVVLVPQHAPQNSGNTSVHNQKARLPGAFSTSSMTASSAYLAQPQSGEQRSWENQSNQSTADMSDVDKATEHCVSIVITSVELASDISTLKLLVLIGQYLRNIEERKDEIKVKPNEPSMGTPFAPVDFRLESFRWIFVDSLHASSCIKERESSLSGNLIPSSEVLLMLSITGLAIHRSSTPMGTNHLDVHFRKFAFGYSGENILSFDATLKLRDSTNDLQLSPGNDVSLKVESGKDALRANFSSLPLLINLNLMRLEETFSWFGGLSGVIELGSSMMSTVTVVDTRPKPDAKTGRSRGVRFTTDEPPTNQTQESHTVHNKVTARVSGITIYVFGQSCEVRFRTSALKLVSRTEGIGLQIDKAEITGPRVSNNQDPGVMLNLINTRIEYLSIPHETDLTRLLGLVSPSREVDGREDDIMLDTLLKQRRQGGVLRCTVANATGHLSDLDCGENFLQLGQELGKLSTVAKYLPENDRPGILTLLLLRQLNFDVHVNDHFGTAKVICNKAEIAQVTLPSLLLLGIDTISVTRDDEQLFHRAVPEESNSQSPMIILRFLSDEMEPTFKVKLSGAQVDYHVTTAMAVLGITETASGEVMLTDIINSVATLRAKEPLPRLQTETTFASDRSEPEPKVIRFDVNIQDSIIGLNPRKSAAQGLLVLTNAKITGNLAGREEPKSNGLFDVKKASFLVIDRHPGGLGVVSANSAADSQLSQLHHLARVGYVSVCEISVAKVNWTIAPVNLQGSSPIDIEIKDELFVLETCADSTQTIQAVFNGLKPPMPPSTELKYRTEVGPMQDMLASLTADGFLTSRTVDTEVEIAVDNDDDGDMMDDDVPQNLEYVNSLYSASQLLGLNTEVDRMLREDLESITNPPETHEIGSKNLLQSFREQYQVAPDLQGLEFHDNHFDAKANQGIQHTWDSGTKAFDVRSEATSKAIPLRIQMKDVHIIWNLYDGYDWQHTRDTIGQAVADVEQKAIERLARQEKRKTIDSDNEESVIGDFLFNSIYIGIPANRDPRDLASQINREIDDLVSETGSYATLTTATESPTRKVSTPRSKRKRLRLVRSKAHKLTFELTGVSADVKVFAPGMSEVESTVDIRVHNLEIFDHVPTSSWKKFATYMHDAGERQMGDSMVHIEIQNVKPVPELAASEIVLTAKILPLRLHVDQDALDFMTRFFEFKDPSAPVHSTPSDVPFIQRAEIHAIPLKLDFKPKRVDYASIRSGHTNEFMNFLVLEQSNMTLRRCIVYGVLGFDKLGKTLNDIWMPDIKKNQLPGVLAGIAPVRNIVNVGGGVRQLMTVPIREYRKDGRIMRSLSKGAFAFAKTTTTEVARLGAKLAIGTQAVLQGAEDYLVSPPSASNKQGEGWDDDDLSEDDDESRQRRHISLYADPPANLAAGLKGAYRSLSRDLMVAKDAVVALPGDVMESSSAGGAARAVLRGAPMVILRPAIGVTRAVGQALQGATSSLDKDEKRRIDDKYKRR